MAPGRSMSTPYTFWEATLPSGDAVKVIISPWQGEVGVIVHLNGVLDSLESFPTVVQAERRARHLRVEMLGAKETDGDH